MRRKNKRTKCPREQESEQIGREPSEGPFRSLPNVSWRRPGKKGYLLVFALITNSHLSPVLPQLIPLSLEVPVSFLFVPLARNQAALSQTERVGSGASVHLSSSLPANF